MYNQMEQFEDGGLRDEGGTVDEVSGNEVPVGGTKKGVRDDIPAMVSEGEFIFPEDVTRYIGLDKLMQLRQDAKMGLKKMEAMGQMGNGDEATIEDDMPFSMADLIIVGSPMEEPQEKYKGGVLHAQQGTYVGQQQQPATGIAGYQPSVYANRAPINPYQYQAPASAFTPPTYQNTQVAPSQPTSGYMPKFVGQGVTRKTVTGRETPRVEAEQFVEDIYLEVKYINRETGDIRTFKFYEGEPISEIPAGYVPYEEGQDPAEGTTPPEGDVATTTTQVSRGSDDDDDRAPPPPPPFNWDEATPEAIVNEVNKIQGPAGSVITGLAFALNPVLGGLAYAATKANEKQTLTKLDELLKDKAFVKKMSDAGQLKKLKDSLTGLEEKTKGEGKGTVNIDLLGKIGVLIKGVTGALKGILTPEQEKNAIAGAVSSAAEQDPTKKDNIITLAEQAEAEAQVSLDVFGGEGTLPETTSVLGKTSVVTPDTTKTLTAEEIARIVAGTPEEPNAAETASVIIQKALDAARSGVTTEVPIDPIIAAARRSAEQGAAAFRALEDQPPEEEDSADPLSMAQATMKAMTRDRQEQREAAFEPEFLEGLGGAPLGFEAGQVDPALAAAVTSQPTTPTVTIPTPAPTPAPTVTTAPRRESRDPGPSGAERAMAASKKSAAASAVAKSEGVSAPTSGGARSVSTPTGNVETYASKVKRGGGFNKGGLANKPKKKASSKKRGLAARK